MITSAHEFHALAGIQVGAEPLRALLRRDPLLVGVGLGMLFALMPTLIAAAVDDRTLYGIDIWTKPLKFQASVGLYLLTLAWFWAWLPVQRRQSAGARLTRALVIATALFEVGYISLQSARGVGSHFNVATPLEAAMFNLMGLAALLLTAASALLGVWLWRAGAGPRPAPLHAAAVAGLVITGVSGIVTGMVIAAHGGHWVGGVNTDAAGLALFGWSRSGGDLRVAHFFAIHAMQLLPAAGWAASMLPRRAGGAAVMAASVAMVTVIVLTLAQALGGEPFMAFID
jgi:hypothetical protein